MAFRLLEGRVQDRIFNDNLSHANLPKAGCLERLINTSREPNCRASNRRFAPPRENGMYSSAWIASARPSSGGSGRDAPRQLLGGTAGAASYPNGSARTATADVWEGGSSRVSGGAAVGGGPAAAVRCGEAHHSCYRVPRRKPLRAASGRGPGTPG